MYKLINLKTKEEHLCDKVTIGEFDYYVSDEEIKVGDWYTWDGNKNNAPSLCTDIYNESSILDSQGFIKFHKVITSNNPNIDIPKVVDNVEKLAWDIIINDSSLVEPKEQIIGVTAFYEGYYNSQETHPNSDDDMIEFAHFYFREEFNSTLQDCKSSEEIFQLWKEQQLKIVYYE